MAVECSEFMSVLKSGLKAVDDGKCTIASFARIFMWAYADLQTTHSGLVSSKLVYYHAPTKRTYRKRRVCEEHFVTRTETMTKIVEMHLAGKLTDDLLEEMIIQGNTVHLVTGEENIALMNYQSKKSRNYVEGWEAQYKAAGITLVPDPGPRDERIKFYYEIDGKFYVSKQEACSELNITESRLATNVRKMPGWVKHQYENY